MGGMGPGNSSLEDGGERNYHCCLPDTVLSAFHAPFYPLSCMISGLLLPYLQIGKLRQTV